MIIPKPEYTREVILIQEYLVWQMYHCDNPPEPFGYYQSSMIPNIDDLIQLKWSDGNTAFKLKVTKVDDKQKTIWGYAVD